MLYVGHDLQAVSQWAGPEPALINPKLAVDTRHADRAGVGLHYWPAYHELPPATRGAYLLWLAGGRCDPGVPVGFVFLFFYGLERRSLIDSRTSPAAQAEIPGMRAEVERLLRLYGDSRSFHGYATRFLEALDLLAGIAVDIDGPPPAFAGDHTWWEIPLLIRLGLATFAAAGRSLPASWALAWVESHPDVHLRTPTRRCREEFTSLFSLRYGARYGDGMVVKPNKTKLTVTYRPASGGFHGEVSLSVGDLSDVSALSAPVRKLAELAHSCSDELDAYSRWLGRHPDGAGTLPAVALLPAELAAGAHGEADELCRWVDSQLDAASEVVIDGTALTRRWPSATADKLTKADAVALAQLLGRRGYGMEPDVRFGGPPLSAGPAVVFRLAPNAPTAAGPAYRAATVLLQLAAAVSGADGEVSDAERRHLAMHLEGSLHLAAAERRRLTAHLSWLVEAEAGLRGVKKRLVDLQPDQRSAIGEFLVGVAAADGVISPTEIVALTKIFQLLGLNPADVYSQVHALGTTSEAAPGPVVVRAARPGMPGQPIPPRPTELTATVRLDPARVEAKLAETAAVSALLGSIFIDDETPLAAVATDTRGVAPIAGLDSAHSILLRHLATRDTWSRAEVEALAEESGLLPDGALDTLNEAGLDVCGEPVCESDGDVEMNGPVLKELLR
jgi:tellurite resistance protein